MANEFRAKVFKSGNSLALRLPKGLGLKEGTEMTVREDRGRYEFEPVTPADRIDLMGLWGSCPDLKPLIPEEREFDPSPRVWDDPEWVGWSDRDGR